MKIRLCRVLSGKIGKRFPVQREVPLSGRKRARERLVVLKRKTLGAKRSHPVREEESKGMGSCPEKKDSRRKEKSPCQGGREQGNG
jgi:hypothetical protein